MLIGKAGTPVTQICQAYPDRVEVRGRDLCGDLMGRLSASLLAHLAEEQEEPIGFLMASKAEEAIAYERAPEEECPV